MIDREKVALALEALGATAKMTASDVKAGKLWPGQLSEALSTMRRFLATAEGEARDDR